MFSIPALPSSGGILSECGCIHGFFVRVRRTGSTVVRGPHVRIAAGSSVCRFVDASANDDVGRWIETEHVLK